MKRSALNPMSPRRLRESQLYHYRAREFLLRHPYCQVWLAEHQLAEEVVKAQQGTATLPDGSRVAVPLSTEVHHRNKRRGADLLDQSEWLAVSREAHERIENNKFWARARGYLRSF